MLPVNDDDQADQPITEPVPTKVINHLRQCAMDGKGALCGV